MIYNELLKKAENLKPTLNEKVFFPENIIEIIKDDNGLHGYGVKKIRNINELSKMEFGRGDNLILDFGQHLVGYVTLDINFAGYIPDAPLGFKISFGEMPCEIAENNDDYNGDLSKCWFQEETIFVDVLPQTLNLERRYSFRYLKIEIIDTSVRFKGKFEKISCNAVTSADLSKIELLRCKDESLKKFDDISIKTLQECMQTVLEDGPKRDRRLWIGDLRLQALANYKTFKNYNIVKRCMYMFAGLTNDNGWIMPYVFEKPYPMTDYDRTVFDYALFFVPILRDYFDETKDEYVLKELWPIAYNQIKLALSVVDELGIVKDDDNVMSVIDWAENLNKQASNQAILIYAIKNALFIAKNLSKIKEYKELKYNLEILEKAALTHLWDKDKKLFVSGKGKQISYHSQIWMIIAEVIDKDEAKEVLKRIAETDKAVKIVTPYMYHHYIEALISIGEKDKALNMIKEYWGIMINNDADCFWEICMAENMKFSPYGDYRINSYCHAWSCTPTYFIRKYFNY